MVERGHDVDTQSRPGDSSLVRKTRAEWYAAYREAHPDYAGLSTVAWNPQEITFAEFLYWFSGYWTRKGPKSMKMQPK